MAVCAAVCLWLAADCRAERQPEGKQVEDQPTAAMPPLTEQEAWVIEQKGTERPFTGKYWNSTDVGVYLCRKCGTPLYTSKDKFQSDCGWPSFDQELPGAVKRVPDADGQRTEIVCAHCGAHLGHVFEGEGLTAKNTRHCVNSISLVFRPAKPVATTEEALFAGGCFWGVDHAFKEVKGVSSVTSGYSGGTTKDPTYEQVCTGATGHAETVKVVFDPRVVTYEQLAKLFLEIHDPTTLNRQGPDAGTQYRSAVFYHTDEQRQSAEKLIQQLKANGYKVVTEVTPAGEFYPAEEYHQDYLTKHPGRQDCHVRVRRFDVVRK